MTTQNLVRPNATYWAFWGTWATAFLGFPAGGVAGMAIIGGVTGVPQAAIGGAVTGAVIGSAQWLVLRRRVPLSPFWIAATALGMGVGLATGVGVTGIDFTGDALFYRGLITGAAIGLAQYPLLRSVTTRAAVWPFVVSLGWALGWFITRSAGVHLEPNFTVFGSTGAITFQILTGVVLAWMLRGTRTTD